MNITSFISDLLVKNNCVIVPNFGGFIANYKSASVDSVKKTIYPPRKNVIFNANLINNDGLLAEYVSRKIGKTYAESVNFIAEKVGEWHTILTNGERIEIGEVGFIYKENEKIQFEQNREFNLLLSAYGLSEVKFLAVPKEAVKKTERKIIELTPVLEETSIDFSEPSTVVIREKTIEGSVRIDQQKKSSSKRWKYLAVACCLPFLFYSYWIPMNTSFLDTGNIQMSDLNPMNVSAERAYSNRLVDVEFDESGDVRTWDELIENINSDVKFYNYKFDDELYIPVSLVKSNSVQESVVINEDIIFPIETNTAQAGNIHLIAGCFSNESNANVLILDLKSKGFDGRVLDKNKGLYRVSAGSFSSKEDAMNAKENLSNVSVSTWVLNK